jgi:hypothetical protein
LKPPPAPGKAAIHFGSTSSEDIGDEEGDSQRVDKANAGEGKEERCISDPLMDVPHILEMSREISDVSHYYVEHRMRMQFA